MRQLFFGLAIAGLLLLILRLGLFRFSKTIYNSKDCQQFTLDHLEARTGISLPNLITIDCNFDSLAAIKIHEIQIDTLAVDLQNYMQGYPFTEIDSIHPDYTILDTALFDFKNIDLLGFSQEEKTHQSEFIINQANGKMWVALKYIN